MDFRVLHRCTCSLRIAPCWVRSRSNGHCVRVSLPVFWTHVALLRPGYTNDEPLLALVVAELVLDFRETEPSCLNEPVCWGDVGVTRRVHCQILLLQAGATHKRAAQSQLGRFKTQGQVKV